MKHIIIATALLGLSLGAVAGDWHAQRPTWPSYHQQEPSYGQASYLGWHAYGPPRAQWLLRQLDVDRNGMLSRAEIGNHGPLQRRFHALDTNHDRQLSRRELRALVETGRPRDRFWERSN